MTVRRILTVAIVFVAPLAALATQETLVEIFNWPAPPYWSPSDGKPAKEPADAAGSFDAEVADVIPSPPMPFVAINPCRIADTRGLGFSGQAGPPAITVGVTRSFQVSGTVPGIPVACGIPVSAQAVSFQFSVTGMNSAGNLIAWPEGAPPTTSVLNWNANSVAIGSGTVVGLSGTGSVNVQLNGNPGASTHLIIDVNGYYSPVGIVNTINGLSGTVTLAAGTNVSITPAGNTLTIASTGGGGSPAWSLTGNAGTTPGTDFLGTTDNQRLEIKVNNARVMRYEPTGASPNVVGGRSLNTVTAGVIGATIAGGGGSPNFNSVTDNFGTIGGGDGNRAGDGAGTVGDRSNATVGGGVLNIASGIASTIAGGAANQATVSGAAIGGGSGNIVSGIYATIAGGYENAASGQQAAVAGGNTNVASGLVSMVGGGILNTAAGAYSSAAGRRAKANHQGAYVWGDSTDADVVSSVNNQFVARATGGFRFFVSGGVRCDLTDVTGWSCQSPSDRALKENVEPVDGRAALSRLMTIPIQTWSYIDQKPAVRHMGPMAQDFAAAFGLGTDDKTINPLDANGVALAAIQALYEEVQVLRKRLEELEAKKD